MMAPNNDRADDGNTADVDAYLWDRSGTPDPEIQRLEGLLGRFRSDRVAPMFPEVVRQKRWFSQLRLFPALTAATAVVAIAVVGFLMQRKHTPANEAGWDVSHVAGAPRIGSVKVSQREGARRLDVGQVLETDHQSSVSIQSENVGQIEIDPGTRLRLLRMGAGVQQIALERGTIHARIWAPAGQFVVETPSATTVDLGCVYSLHVEDSGSALVRTSMGWVGFKLNGRESFIPAGAACSTRPKVGPGTPYFEDSSTAFRNALTRFDFEDSTPEQRAADIAILLKEARSRDALTLWHLLARVDQPQRRGVYDRLKTLAPPPTGVTRDGVLSLDQAMLDEWWNALGFDDISVWRHWERAWSESVPADRNK